MDRRKQLIIGGTIAGVVAAVVLWEINTHFVRRRETPVWTDPEQPAEGTAGLAQAIGVPNYIAAWCAARPGDPGLRSGSRVMRMYAPTLKDDPESVVR